MGRKNRVLAAVLASGVLSTAGALGAQATTDTTTMNRGRLSTPFGIFQIGAEGGVAISNFVGSDANDSKNRTGAYGGLTFILQKNESAVGFQTGALWVQKGTKFDDDEFAGSINLDYLEVPLLLRIGVPISAGFSPTLLVGGSLAWRIRCRVEANVAGIDASTDCNGNNQFDIDPGIRRFDGGLSAGVEFPITMGGRYIFVPSVRYTRGLTSLSDADGTDIKNSSIQIGLGIRFR